jgi:hypothetical protein
VRKGRRQGTEGAPTIFRLPSRGRSSQARQHFLFSFFVDIYRDIYLPSLPGIFLRSSSCFGFLLVFHASKFLPPPAAVRCRQALRQTAKSVALANLIRVARESAQPGSWFLPFAALRPLSVARAAAVELLPARLMSHGTRPRSMQARNQDKKWARFPFLPDSGESAGPRRLWPGRVDSTVAGNGVWRGSKPGTSVGLIWHGSAIFRMLQRM